MKKEPNALQQGFLIVARTLTLLALVVWLGGMVFFGPIAAPVLFKVARANGVPQVAPVMVGEMLTRFSLATLLCCGLLLFGWLVEAWFTPIRKQGLWMWRIQGFLTVVAIVLGVFLGQVLLPAIQVGQERVLPAFIKKEADKPLTARESRDLATFNLGHKKYQQLAMVNFWCLVGVLGLMTTRITRYSPRSAEAAQPANVLSPGL